MTWVVQIIICLLIVYGVIASETKIRKLLLIGILFLYTLLQCFIYFCHPALAHLFPVATFQNGQMIAAAQYYGFSLYREYVVLYLPLIVLLGLFILLRIIEKKYKTQYVSADKPSRLIVRPTDSKQHLIWETCVSITLWFHILFFVWTMVLQPKTPLSPTFFISSILLSCALTCLDTFAIRKKILINPNIQISLATATCISWILYFCTGISGVPMSGIIVTLTVLFSSISGHLYKKLPLKLSKYSIKQTCLILLNGIIVLFPLCYEHITEVNTTFDSQNFATWFYAATRGFFPNKDIFYLYGFMTYWQNGSAIMKCILMFYVIALLLFVFHLIKKISSSDIVAAFVYLCMLLLIYICGYWPLYRYVSPCVLIGLTAYALSKQKKATMVLPIFGGVGTSILFFLFNDAGIIACIALSILFLIDSTIPRIKQHFSWKDTIHHGIITIFQFIIGLSIGASPFLIFLALQGALIPFFDFFSITSHIPIYAKFLYFAGGWMEHDIPISLVIWTACIILLYTYIFQFRKFRSAPMYMTLGWTIILLILQFKNTLRPIGNDIIIILFLVLCSLCMYVQKLLNKYQNWRHLISVGICALLITYFSSQFSLQTIQERSKMLYYLYAENWTIIPSHPSPRTNIQHMIDADAHHISTTIDADYDETHKWITAQPDFSGMIYSFPGDPIFYSLFHQTPAPFFDAYDASSKPAQIKNIAFIKDNDIRYIIYNEDCELDDIPVPLRNAYISTYVLQHFTPVRTIGKFMILKKTDAPSDIFDTDTLNANTSIKTNLLDLQMENIPMTEGLSLAKEIQKTHTLVSGSLQNINLFLTKHTIPSDTVALLVSSAAQDTQQISLRITANQEKQTTIHFNACTVPRLCFIHLERLPLFARQRSLTSIEQLSGAAATFRLISLPATPNMW